MSARIHAATITPGDIAILSAANERLRDAIEWFTDVVPDEDVAVLRDALGRFEALHRKWGAA